jgi:hypothetical protein
MAGWNRKVAALAALAACMDASAQQSFAELGGRFSTPVNYTVGTSPYSVVVADFNKDGKLDLATGNSGSDNVTVLLGVGDGSFLPAMAHSAGDGTEGLAVADFNGDGKNDIAAANLLGNSVSVFLGNGTGGFAGAASFGVGFNPHAPVSADFNADGKADLATADGSQGTVSVLLGNGAGSFSTSVQYPACGNPRDLVTSDFNQDGKTDVAVTCQAEAKIVVLMGNGAGAFGAPVGFLVGTEPFGLSTGYFDAGGTVDLAVTGFGSAKVSILLGNGAGGFSPAGDLAPQAYPHGATTFDGNGDGKPDLVVSGGSEAMVFAGTGNGSFGPGSAFPAGGPSSASAAGDFNADGKTDLAVVGLGTSVAVLLNASVAPLDIQPSQTVERDSSYAARKADIWVNRQTSGTYPAGWPFSHTGYADIDRDGDTDFLRTFSDADSRRIPVQVMINDGQGGFTDQTATRIVGPQPGVQVARKVLSGDYDSDGWPDFLVLGHGADAPPFPGEYPQLFLSNGDGTLSYAPGLEGFVGFNHGGASADVDGNGTVDVFVNAARPYFLLNDGSGHFTEEAAIVPREASGSLINPIATELLDVDRDGYIDLLVDGYEPFGSSNAIYWGSSTGVYQRENRTILVPVPDMGITLDFAVEDIDGDGDRDVIVDRTGSTNLYQGRYIQILRQTASRTFVDETATRIVFDGTLLPLDYIRLQDINGDGSVDLFTDDRNDIASAQYAWTNNGQGVFSPYTGPVSPSNGRRLSIADAAVTEGQGGSKQLDFTVRLSGPAIAPVSFDIYTDPGTATPGSDYVANAALAVVIAPGEDTATFSVTVHGDSEVEGHETFAVHLANAVNATLLDGQAQGRILNDDLAALSILDASISEGNVGASTLAFVIELSRPMPNPVTFDVATSNGSALAGTDYIARNQPGRFLDAGRTRLAFDVTVHGDAAAEAHETFVVTVSNVSGATLGDGSATGTILNDDAAPVAARRMQRKRAVQPAPVRPAKRPGAQGAAPKGVDF